MSTGRGTYFKFTHMFASIPPATRTLILVNVAMFAFEAMGGDMLTVILALWPLGSAGRIEGVPGF